MLFWKHQVNAEAQLHQLAIGKGGNDAGPYGSSTHRQMAKRICVSASAFLKPEPRDSGIIGEATERDECCQELSRAISHLAEDGGWVDDDGGEGLTATLGMEALCRRGYSKEDGEEILRIGRSLVWSFFMGIELKQP